MKRVTGITTGIIGGGLLAVGVYMAYRKYFGSAHKTQIEDDLTISNIYEYDLTKSRKIKVDSSLIKIDIDTKNIFLYKYSGIKREREREQIHHPYRSRNYFTGWDDCARLNAQKKEPEHVTIQEVYYVVFKNMDRACNFLGIDYIDTYNERMSKQYLDDLTIIKLLILI